MQGIQGRALQAFRRIVAWFLGHPEVVTGSGTSATGLQAQITALQGVIARMSTQAATQDVQASQTTLVAHDELALREELLKTHVGSIVEMAQSLIGQVPGMGLFAMPTGNSPERWLHAAQAIRTSATVYESVFVENGLPSDFLAQLDGAISALQTSMDARGTALNLQTDATKGLVDEVKLGKSIVRKINSILRHALKTDPATMDSWQQVKRVTVKGVVAAAPAAPAAGTQQPASTPAAPANLTVVNGVTTPAPAAGSSHQAESETKAA